MPGPIRSVSCFLLAAIVTAVRAQHCTPDWIQTFQGGDLGGTVRALAVFDFDGDGPERPSLVALHRGQFSSQPRAVARWTGTDWVSVGGEELARITTASGDWTRGAFAAFDDDGPGPRPTALYVCGGITPTGPGATRGIARFNGVAWEPVGPDFSTSTTSIHDLEVFDEDGPGPLPPALFAAGARFAIGDPDAGNILRWDGAQWTEVGSPLKFGEIRDLQLWDPDGPGPIAPLLCAAGSFDNSNADPPGPSYLAAWNGTGWSSIGAGAAGRPGHGLAIAVFDPDSNGPSPPLLVVAGGSNDVDGNPGSISAWNGQTWTRIMDLNWQTPQPFIARMLIHDDDGAGPILPALYIAADPGMNASWRGISRWDGIALRPLGGEDPGFPGVPLGGTQRSVISAPSATTSQFIDALASFDLDGNGPEPPRLVVGGGFTAVAQPLIDVCGSIYLTEEVSANFVATWNGAQWESLGRGLSAPIPGNAGALSMVPFDPDDDGPAPSSLVIHGTFSTAGPIPIPLRTCQSVGNSGDSSGFVRANTRWNAIDGWERAGLDPDIDPRTSTRRILPSTQFGGVPHIAGSFDRIDGVPISGGPIARWNHALRAGARSSSSSGSGGWESIGNLTGGTTVHALLPFDPDGAGPAMPLLIAAGDFDSVWLGEHSASGAVVAWNGSQWTTLDFSAGSAIVTDLINFDPDENGPLLPRLIAAGDFVHNTPSGQARDIAQYHPSNGWTPLAPPGGGFFTGQADPNSPVQVNALAVFDDDGPGPNPPALYVGGNFFQWTDGVTPIPCRGIARWNGASWSAVPTNVNPPTGLGVNFTSAVVYDLIVFDADGPTPAGPMRESLFVGGAFDVPGTAPPSKGIACWDGAQWSTMGAGLSFVPYSVSSLSGPAAIDLEVFDDDGDGPNAPALFIAGLFLRAGDHSAWAIAKWGCTTWDAVPPLCPGDADGNNAVNFADITSVLTNWLMTYPPGSGSSGPGDANHDGTVNFADITAVLTNFGLPCP